jgi:hypothetical protein
MRVRAAHAFAQPVLTGRRADAAALTGRCADAGRVDVLAPVRGRHAARAGGSPRWRGYGLAAAHALTGSGSAPPPALAGRRWGGCAGGSTFWRRYGSAAPPPCGSPRGTGSRRPRAHAARGCADRAPTGRLADGSPRCRPAALARERSQLCSIGERRDRWAPGALDAARGRTRPGSPATFRGGGFTPSLAS